MQFNSGATPYAAFFLPGQSSAVARWKAKQPPTDLWGAGFFLAVDADIVYYSAIMSRRLTAGRYAALQMSDEERAARLEA
jgi:hypothetical protein